MKSKFKEIVDKLLPNHRINTTQKQVFNLVCLALVLHLNFFTIEANRDLNNLLANDLNIIATKIDEIPETILNLKLVLIADECNDIKLNWKIHQNKKVISKAKSNIISILNNSRGVKKNQADNHQKNTNIFGYQVVVREYLENERIHNKKKSQYLIDDDETNEKTLRVYSSKFIDSKQNKFKLINLLRKDKASYHICLIIYIDVTETVAFEKQCVNFSLPVSSTIGLEESEMCKNKRKQSFDKKIGKMTTSTLSREVVSSTHNYNSTNLHAANEKDLESETALHSKFKSNKTSNINLKQVYT
jgi:hypothetical protein